MLSLLFGVYLLLADSRPLPAQPRGAVPLPDEVVARLALEPDRDPFTETAATDPEGRDVLACRIPFKREGTETGRAVLFDFYRADEADEATGGKREEVAATEKRPAVVVNPITGGGYELERAIARDLCAHGYHAVLVKRPSRPETLAALGAFDSFENRMRDTLASGHRIIDWLADRPEVDASRIGAYGVSLGGMLTVMLAATDSRIVASVAMMAGGDFPAVLARSVEPEARHFAAANGLKGNPTAEALAAFEERARAAIPTDPLALAAHVDPRSIFLVNTRRDTSVPSFLQERLREALGFPETLSLPTGHYSVGFYLPLAMAHAREFLARRFAAR